MDVSSVSDLGEQLGRVISWKNPSYGWIRCANGNITEASDIFVHLNDVLPDRERLPVGVRVKFRLQETPKGLRAVSVEPIEEPSDDRPIRRRR